jgi:hypothetical protein
MEKSANPLHYTLHYRLLFFQPPLYQSVLLPVQMQQILYQNYKEDKGSFKRTLKSKEVERAVTLHPVKDPLYQYRIFNYLRTVNIMKFKQRQVMWSFWFVCM